MFEKLVKPVVRKSVTVSVEIPLTQAFVTCVKEQGCRLSYAALALAARLFKEDSSTQIPAQRGSTLVKSLPVDLHPIVCRKSGGYKKEVFAAFGEQPEDLLDRPVITEEAVGEAVAIYLKESRKKSK